MANYEPVVNLDERVSLVRCGPSTRLQAVTAALYVTLSPHEHVWTQEQQVAMAQYCLWAAQRLAAIEQCVNGPLERPMQPQSKEKP